MTRVYMPANALRLYLLFSTNTMKVKEMLDTSDLVLRFASSERTLRVFKSLDRKLAKSKSD
jgi:hypothetical protein